MEPHRVVAHPAVITVTELSGVYLIRRVPCSASGNIRIAVCSFACWRCGGEEQWFVVVRLRKRWTMEIVSHVSVSHNHNGAAFK